MKNHHRTRISSLSLFSIVLCIFCCSLISAIPIDNGLSGQPIVFCGASQMAVMFSMEKPFSGNVYTKGHFMKDECRQKGDALATAVNITIAVDSDCGLRRRRTVNPRGITLELTVVVMFHNLFLTKVDRAFHVQCFYMEASKEVTQKIEVSMIPSTEISQPTKESDTLMPNCKYQVLKGGPEGSAVTFAIIGDPVYHKWTCEGTHAQMYCITVHSCSVDDGQGIAQKLLDENGCSLDRYLLSNLEYPTPMQAGQEAHVFKFADRPTVFFSCQIRLDLREDADQACIRTSDKCSSTSSSVNGAIGGTPTAPLTPYESSSIDDASNGGPPAQRPPIEEDFPKPSAFNIGDAKNAVVPVPRSASARTVDSDSTDSEVIVDSEDETEGTHGVKRFDNSGPPAVHFIDSSIGNDKSTSSRALKNVTSSGYRHNRHDDKSSAPKSKPSRLRPARQSIASRQHYVTDMDVAAPAVDIIDLPESSVRDQDPLSSSSDAVADMRLRDQLINSGGGQQRVCVSKILAVVCFAAALILLFIIVTVMISIIWKATKNTAFGQSISSSNSSSTCCPYQSKEEKKKKNNNNCLSSMDSNLFVEQ